MKPEARPFNIVLAAFAVLLHKYTREERVVVGSTTDVKKALCALRIDIANGGSGPASRCTPR
jgi:hypothetical protein